MLTPLLDQLRAPRRRAWAPVVVALVGFAATVVLGRTVSSVVAAARNRRFEDSVERTLVVLDHRLRVHAATATAALAVLELRDGPGAVTFARLASQLTDHRPRPTWIAWCARVSRPDRDSSCVVSRIWPEESTARGDLSSVVNRAGTSRAYAAVRLQDSRSGADVALVFPTSDGRSPSGVLIVAFRSSELLRDAVDRNAECSLVSIRDAVGPVERVSDAVDGQPGFAALRSFGFGHVRWLLRFDGTSLLERDGQEPLIYAVWIAGAFVSVLFTALTWSEFLARARAERVGQQLAEADEELRRASRAKDEFLAMLGHELRNPLGAIANALKVIRMRRVEDPVVPRALDIAERQVTHQTRLVDDLLDLTRLGAGKIQLTPQPRDLRELARRAVATTRLALEERGHALVLLLAPDPVGIFADPTRVEQVLVNLLTNAIKYTPEGGTIQLTVQADPVMRQAVVRVADDGVGIDPMSLENVFKPFFQEPHEGAVPTQRGLGIGLTIVRSLVGLLGGSVTARSAGHGKGSEFEIRLPLSRLPDVALRASAPTPTPAVRPALELDKSMNVLVVEDMDDSREMLAELVSMFGHRVRQAESAERALGVMDQELPDLAFVDLGLPGMDGFELARKIRGLPNGSRTRLVALTGFGSPEDRHRAFDAGFDEHLSKPIAMKRLAELLTPPS
jgi:signal transduction histidine kinase/CheY-like chemotaxis protein